MSVKAGSSLPFLGRLFFVVVLVGVCASAAVVGWHFGRARVGELGGPKVDVSMAEDVAATLLTDFRLPTLDERQLGPRDFRGKVVLVEFWATWCGPCHVQANILAKLHDSLALESHQFLAVSLSEAEDVVRAFVAERPFPYPVLLDEAGTLQEQAAIYALPTLVIIDPEGKVVFRQSGIVPRRTLERVLAEAGLQKRSDPGTSG